MEIGEEEKTNGLANKLYENVIGLKIKQKRNKTIITNIYTRKIS